MTAMKKRAGWKILCFVFLVWGCLTKGQQRNIPPHIKEQLDKATTYEEFRRLVNIMPSSRTSSAGTSNQPRGGGVGGVAPSAARTHGSSDYTRGGRQGTRITRITNINPNATIIYNPIKSRDSCKLVNVCVPLPLVAETGFIIFPPCIELPQCVGGCCDRTNNCKATAFEDLSVKYWNHRIVFEGLDEAGFGFVPMRRHKNCSCDRSPDDDEDEYYEDDDRSSSDQNYHRSFSARSYGRRNVWRNSRKITKISP